MELTLDQALQKGIEAHKAGKAQEADRYYTAILKANPSHPDANHNMGVLAVGVGKLEQALPFFKTALETNSSIDQYWLSYIDALIKLDRMDDAKVAFDQARGNGAKGDSFDKLEKRLSGRRNDQEPTQKQVQTLIDLYSQGKYQETINRAAQLLEQFTNSINLYNIIGAANQSLGNLEEAIKAYKKSLSIKPDYAEAHNNIGVTLREQGKLDKAVTALKKALSIKPDYAEAYNNIGIVLRNLGKLEEAIEAYTKALSLKPGYAQALNNIGVALQDQGKLDQAIVAFNKSLSINPDYAEAHHNLGNALKKQGQLDKAVMAFSKALSIKPGYADTYNNMGNTLKEQGEINKAVEAYTKALSIKPDYGSARHMVSALTGKKTETAPREYVETLFDGYSSNFENSLVTKLEYKIPNLISELILQKEPYKSLGSVLDLGCGSGLVGPEIRGYCSQLEGIDLSSKMLELAKKKNVYDKLSHSDIVEYLSSRPLSFDYYMALDVFVYVGELTEIFRLIKSRNKKPGHLVFSTEHTELDGYHILKTGRYAHSRTYIETLCKEFEYTISHFSTTNLRKEKDNFLTGGIYILNF